MRIKWIDPPHQPNITSMRSLCTSISLFLFTTWLSESLGFSLLPLESSRSIPKSQKRLVVSLAAQQKDENNNDDNIIDDDNENTSWKTTTTTNYVIDKSLTRPLINVNRESILFGDQPATAANNNALKLWTWLVTWLPRVVTGVDKDDTDNNNDNNAKQIDPWAGLYNLVLVRLPTIAAGLVYVYNLTQGHPLIIDWGDGPTTVSPVVVGAVLYWILR